MDIRRLFPLAALLALSCAVQAWTITHAVVPALDAVRYVLLAQAYHRDGLLPTVRAEAEHPLFPTLIWLTHSGRQLLDAHTDDWALSAQLAAAASLVLSLIPVYLLLLRLVDSAS